MARRSSNSACFVIPLVVFAALHGACGSKTPKSSLSPVIKVEAVGEFVSPSGNDIECRIRAWVTNIGSTSITVPTRLGELDNPPNVFRDDLGTTWVTYTWTVSKFSDRVVVQPDSEIGLTRLGPGESVELRGRVLEHAGSPARVLFSSYEQGKRDGVWSGRIVADVIVDELE